MTLENTDVRVELKKEKKKLPQINTVSKVKRP